MTPLHLGVALDGAGWHPAAWREPGARPADLFQPGYWVDLAQRAEQGLLDFVTIDDELGLQSDRADRVLGRLDAVLLAARVAPRTRHIGLVPAVSTTHTEPFHVSTALATLDYVSRGRGGWLPQVDPHPGHLGRGLPSDLAGEAADAVEAVRRLWDSWEDDAVIRDVATGRFVDRDKLHYIDFVGEHFSVKGPSIVPRPPQGQLPVLASAESPYGFADVTFTELSVLLDPTQSQAAERKERLDHRAGGTFAAFVGTPAGLAEHLLDRSTTGPAVVRLRPAVLPYDLDQIVTAVVPALQAAGAFRTSYDTTTLRDRLGLPPAVNRYAKQVTP